MSFVNSKFTEDGIKKSECVLKSLRFHEILYVELNKRDKLPFKLSTFLEIELSKISANGKIA